MRTNTVKQRLNEGQTTIGTWLTLPDPAAALQMTAVGFDWLTVDIEHSVTGFQTGAIMCQMIAQAGAIPLMRVPWSSAENVKWALDSGAFGLVFPMQNSKADVEQSVRWAKYPPRGIRGYGPPLAVLGFQTDARTYFEHANDETMIVVQIEQAEALDVLDEILSVEGVDVAFIGPNDLSASMGISPFDAHEHPRFIEAVAHVRERAEAHGVAAGIYAPTAEIARQRQQEGFRFISIADEASHMLNGAKAALAMLR